MRFGLHALGIGSGADPGVIQAVARRAEAEGFATLWAGEHVVMLDDADSPYPYSPDGRIAVPISADWLDPWATLTFAAAATSAIRLATGVVLLPEHHPLVVAKQAASLDALSRGRLCLGIGIGWSAGEFAALGVPFADRGARTGEYVEAIRVLWSKDPSSYAGKYVSFRSVRSFPKPQRGTIPVVIGGNGDQAIKRVARYGDGWYGFNLALAELPARLRALELACDKSGRERKRLDLSVSLADVSPGQVDFIAELGVDELVLVSSPPDSPAAASEWVAELAGHWDVAAHAPSTGSPDSRQSTPRPGP